MIRSFILYLFLALIKLIRILKCPQSGIIFLAPDVPINNLGDQALLLGCIQGMLNKQYQPIFVVANGPQAIKEVYGIERLDGQITILQDLYIVFASDRAFRETLSFFWLTTKARSILLVGADVLDGRYNPEEAARKLSIVNKCNNLGLKAKVVGFSLSETISNESRDAFISMHKNVEFFARDPLSQKRAMSIINCQLGADCAFMLVPEERKFFRQKPLLDWLDKTYNIVAICLRKQDFDIANSSHAVSVWANCLMKLSAERDVNILLLPHHPDDIEMLIKIETEFKNKNFEKYVNIIILPSAREIKLIVSYCLHIVTSRMHVSIASLGMGKPITCLPYAGKFEGLYAHFNLTDASIDRNKMQNGEYLFEFLNVRLQQSAAITSEVVDRLGKVKLLSALNFENL